MPETTKAPTRRRPTQRHKGSPLNEQDWVQAALDILVSENVRGIKIDTLCKKLGVTKGSFYWHFKTRSELLGAMLRHWRKKMTLNVIRSISISGDDPRGRLRNLLSLPRRKNSPAFAQIETSIRDWARRVEMPREAVAEVDEIRFDYITKLFRDMGHPPQEARRRAYLAYCLLMGDSILHSSINPMSQEEFLEKALAMTTGQPDA
ncbi:TetR/AcrR family transcriptional regulator [Salipiger sp. P9]|uniref:TetR/AcrR family transcriptional regulator n=1 Tax=Salipiger pentaromativorans TaxID=2943193 RepID=UPI002157DC0B|nr:TetR/AcrR family transcriptional regulator [Salipiger pentaromativorans]MCR8548862.1 TetR/AcrR family transcriptional regulator [Salipiger pentaromativorans]